MMLRALLMLLLAALVGLLVRALARHLRHAASSGSPRTSEDAAALSMVRCQACGVYLPANSALQVDGANYCGLRCAPGRPGGG